MNELLLLVGLLTVVLALGDELWTTLTVSRAGWLSSHVAGCVGNLTMRGPRFLAENASIAAICASFCLWCTLLWSGWTLIFCGSDVAVIDSTTNKPASFIGRLYFAGFTLTTLGTGDLKPGGSVWRILTALAAGNGFIVVTLSVTYVFSILTALNSRRAIGAAVGHLGASPEDIVGLVNSDGRAYLASRLMSLTSELEQAAIQTDAFPVLEYSHVACRERSFARAVVVLGEVSFLLQYVLDDGVSLPRVVWMPLRRAVDLLIGQTELRKLAGLDLEATPPPDLNCLEELGLDVNPRARIAFESESVKQTRDHWHAWLHWHHRSWGDLRIDRVNRETGGGPTDN